MDWQTEINAAAARIKGHVVRTPVPDFDGFGPGYPVAMKLEQLQHTGSFKARGAFNTLLSQDVPGTGLVAASGGNHGAAVACAAKTPGHRARIFVPEFAGPARIGLIRRSGADLTVVEGEYANAMQGAQVYEAETGAMQGHACDAIPTIAGQGTLAREWEEPGLDAASLIRGRRQIGNSLHWSFDVVMNDDRHRARKDHAPANFAAPGSRTSCLQDPQISFIFLKHSREQSLGPGPHRMKTGNSGREQ